MKNPPTTNEESINAVSLFVKDNSSRIQGYITLSSEMMKELNVEINDQVLVHGKRKKKLICTVISRKMFSPVKVGMNKIMRFNLGVELSTIVPIYKVLPNSIPKGNRIEVKPVYDSLGLTKFWPQVKQSLIKLIKRETLIFTEGNHFILEMDLKSIEFKVVNIFPSPFCYITSETFIQCKGNTATRMKSCLAVSNRCSRRIN